MFTRAILYFLLIVGFTGQCFAMTWDNQFFPFGQQPYSRKYERYSNIIPGAYVVIADKAHGPSGGDTGLFDLFGTYNLRNVAESLEAIGKPNPLRSEWRGLSIPYKVGGHLEALGFSLAFNKAINNHFSYGLATVFMNVKSWITLRLDEKNLGFTPAGPGDIEELDLDVRIANEELGLDQVVSNQTGFGDLDFYLRAGKIWYYPEKFRRIDAGLKLGFLFPTGVRRNINNPASVPFAGNGRYGIYFQGEIEFELKEDLKFGVWGRIIKRLNRTSTQRMPVGNEPVNFGAVVGKFNVDPDVAGVLYPYLMFQDIRDGFGAMVAYYFVKKNCDKFQDCRADKSVPVNFAIPRGLSTWTAEYVSITLLYDFGKRIERWEHAPLVSFFCDIPMQWVAAKKVSESIRVSLTVEFNF